MARRKKDEETSVNETPALHDEAAIEELEDATPAAEDASDAPTTEPPSEDAIPAGEPSDEKPAPADSHEELPVAQPSGEEPARDEPGGEEPARDESSGEEPALVEPEQEAVAEPEEEPPAPAREPAPAPVELAADARYSATGKRKSAIARVILRPGNGGFDLNGHPLDRYFPRRTLQEVVRQPLKVSGYLDRIDVRARIHGGGVSSQADAVRHGIAKALIEADPKLRAELKRRQLLTRDPRVKERRKAGLKKARKRPQFSKR